MPGLLLFDLDNTLIDRTAIFRRWAHDFVSRHGLPVEDVGWLEEQDEDGFRPREDFLDAVRRRYGLRTDTRALVADYRLRYPLFTEPLPSSMRAALFHARSAGWRTGIVTNGQGRQQEEKIIRSGLGDLADGWCVSGVVGIRKPDPEIFRLTAERCGALLENAWMIGDNPDADILGGHAAGLRTVWIRRQRSWIEEAYLPDEIAETVEEAIAVALADEAR